MIILFSRNFNSPQLFSFFFFFHYDHIKVIAFLGARAVAGGFSRTHLEVGNEIGTVKRERERSRRLNVLNTRSSTEKSRNS